MLRYYDSFINQKRLALLREAEREQLARASAQRSGGQKLYHRWAGRLGLLMTRWGQRLERYGEAPRRVGEASQSPVRLVKSVRSLEVVHAGPVRRAEWN